jgi:serine/threonine-protein kinase
VSAERHAILMARFDEACSLAATAQAALIERVQREDAELARELAAMLRHDRTPEIEIVSVLGEGGMGRVLLGRQRCLGREVAVKTLRPESASSAAISGLLAEAALAGSLEHPNIVPVHTLERGDGDMPLLVMKRVEGVAWSALVVDPAHPAWKRVPGEGDRLGAHLRILSSVCNALAYAHSRGIVHRDVKPDNVMVGAFGEVYLVDWGIAGRMDDAAPNGGSVAGTPGYMAPEMATGGPSDARTDVYLLGSTLHFVLTGTTRHRGEGMVDVLLSARESRPLAYGPDVPAELAAVCNRATSRDPAQRFQSPDELREALDAFQRHRGSIELCDSGYAWLRRLRAAMDAREPNVHDRMLEALFRFRESLRVWPENMRAREGQRACAIAMIEYDIAQKNAARAEELLGQLPDPPAGLAASVADLRRKEREREEQAREAVQIRKQMDWSVASVQRASFFVAASVVSIVVWRVVVRDQRENPHSISPVFLAIGMGGALAAMLLLTLLLRKRLFATQVTGRLVIGVMTCAGAMTFSRAIHAIATARTAGIVSMDLTLAALGAALGGVLLARWLWIVAPVMAAGALASRLVPTEAGVIFFFCALLSLGVGLYFSQRSAKASR